MQLGRLGLALAACACVYLAVPAAAFESDALCARDCRPVTQPMQTRGGGAASCYYISATFDGGTKPQAVENSRKALRETIAYWRAGQPVDSGWRTGRLRVRPATARPNPYLRAEVPRELMLNPDVRSREAHTVCWRGVVSPAVCTSAAQVCQ